MFASPRSLVERLRSQRQRRRTNEGAFDTLPNSIECDSIFNCVVCDSPMTLSNDLDIEIGIDGARLHHLHCADCGMRVERLYHPSVGYPTVPAAIVRSLAERQPTSPDTTI